MLWCWLLQFVLQCWLMKVQGCMMLTWTCKNVIWWHMKCQHVRMWDVDMWNVDMWECEMLTCGMLTCENVRCQHVECWHVRMWDVNMQVYENILCLFSMDLRMYVQKLTSHGFENMHCIVLTLRAYAAWCQLYKVFENASWCWHRGHALCTTRCWVWMNLRMCMHHVWPDVGYTQTCEYAHAKHVCLDVVLWMHAAYVWMLSMQECGTMSTIENEDDVNYNVVVPEY